MVTSDERRDVAENLRYMDQYERICYKEQFFDELAETVVGFEDYHDFGTVIEKLADLIDPTTTVDETGVETVADAVHLCECNECGHSVEWVYGEYEYCPRCGSRIVGGNECEKASNPVPLEGGGAE